MGNLSAAASGCATVTTGQNPLSTFCLKINLHKLHKSSGDLRKLQSCNIVLICSDPSLTEPLDGEVFKTQLFP